MSDLVNYHHRNPDPYFGGCRNTAEAGVDGIVFGGVEPLEGAFTFIGRPSIVEAAGLLYGRKPKEVIDRLSDESKPQERVKELQAENDALKAKLASREAFFDALRDQGFIAPDLT